MKPNNRAKQISRIHPCTWWKQHRKRFQMRKKHGGILRVGETPGYLGKMRELWFPDTPLPLESACREHGSADPTVRALDHKSSSFFTGLTFTHYWHLQDSCPITVAQFWRLIIKKMWKEAERKGRKLETQMAHALSSYCFILPTRPKKNIPKTQHTKIHTHSNNFEILFLEGLPMK